MSFFNKIFLILSLFFVASACSDSKTKRAVNSSTFYVETVTGQFAVKALDSQGAVKSKQINMSACLKDNAAMAPIANWGFTITAGDISFERSTDEKGCLYWQEEVEFDFYDAEAFFAANRTVTATKGHKGSVVAEMAVNPWSGQLLYLRNNAAAPQQGIKNLAITYTKPQAVKTEERKIFVDVKMTVASAVKNQNLNSTKVAGLDVKTIGLGFLGMSYENFEVDSLLNLSVAHKYRLNFSVSRIRQTLDKGKTLEPVTTGQAKVSLLLLKDTTQLNEITSSDVITIAQFNTEIINGNVNQDVILKFRDISLITTKSLALLSVELGESRAYFSGVLGPLVKPGPPISLLSTSVNVGQLYSQFAPQEKKNLGPLALFSQVAGYSALKPVDLEKTKGKYKLVQWKNSIFSPEKKDLIFQACYNLFFESSPESFSACLWAPDSYFSFDERTFVEAVNNKTPLKVGLPEHENLKVAVSTSFSKSTDVSRGFGADGKVGLNFELGAKTPDASLLGLEGGASFKGSVGAQAFVSWVYKITNSNSSSISSSRHIAITVESNAFALDLMTRKCALVTLSKEFKKKNKDLNGYYLCDENPKREERTEIYYLITQDPEGVGSPFSDSASSEESLWRMFMRGEKSYQLFKNTLNNKDVIFIFEKLQSAKVRSELSDITTNQEFPGML